MANTGHSCPESCRGAREGAFEALTGEDVGEPSSREVSNIGLPTLFELRKAARYWATR